MLVFIVDNKNRKRIPLKVDRNDTLLLIYETIYAWEGIPPGKYCLLLNCGNVRNRIFSGGFKQITVSSAPPLTTMEELGVYDGACIHMTLRLRGGGGDFMTDHVTRWLNAEHLGRYQWIARPKPVRQKSRDLGENTIKVTVLSMCGYFGILQAG
jgi:hypothetical protein